MKKTFAALLSLLLVLALALSACSSATDSSDTTTEAAEETAAETESSGEATLTDGIYEETTIGMTCFFRFNEDGTYYVMLFDGGYMEAGTYEVVDQEISYREEGYDDSAQAPTATASQTIVCTSYSGSVNEFAYADDTLQDVEMFGFGGYRFFHHNAEYAYDPATDEQSIVVYTFYADNQSGNTLTLYHDKTFVDYTGDVGVEGTWEKTGDSEFTLTDENGTVATLTVSGSTAAYGDKELADAIVEEGAATVINSYSVDEADVGLDISVGLRIDCYSDSTAKLVAVIAATGTDMVIDEGTYELDDLVYCPTFHWNTLGDIAGEPDYANATTEGIPVSVHVTGAAQMTDTSGTVSDVTLDSVLTGTAGPQFAPTSSAAVTVFNSVSAENATVDGLPMPVTLRIDMYSDGTCALVMDLSAYGMEDTIFDTGTYELAEQVYTPTFHFTYAGDIESVPDYTAATAEGLPITVHYTCSMEVDPGDGSTATYVFDSELTGMAIAN